jgi:hypothetical protein
VQLCVRQKICDTDLSKSLFCPDVATLSVVDKKLEPDEKAPAAVPLSKECGGYKQPAE